MGNRYVLVYFYDFFKVSDGSFVIGCGNDKFFEKLCKKVFFREDFLIDERFKINFNCCEYYKVFKLEIEKWFVKYIIKEVVDLILEVGVFVVFIYNFDCVIIDEYIVKVREMIVDISYFIIGNMKVNGNLVKLMIIKVKIDMLVLFLGESNEEIYNGWFGFDSDKIKDLKENGVI